MANAKLVSLYARRFGIGQWSFIGPGSERSGILSVMIVHKENGTILLKGCWWNSQKRMSNVPCYKSIVQRSTQKQRPWKTVDTQCSRFGNG